MTQFEQSGLLDRLGITVLERGWLSSNCTVITDTSAAWVIDTGYGSHAEQTLALVNDVIGHRSLRAILNTHLHSDHCGGNAALHRHHPNARIAIPPGQASLVNEWDVVALTYQPTGQHCPRFTYNDLLVPGTSIELGVYRWQVLAAPGHDPHAVLLFEPLNRVLISGDALWGNGFGVVFPELEGTSAFAAVGDTLDLIESLAPSVVIPGHGPAFADVAPALQRARSRLDQFIQRPDKHAEYAAKVLVKFHLLEVQSIGFEALEHWYRETTYFALVHQHHPHLDLSLKYLLRRLVEGGAARVNNGQVIDT